MERAEEHLGARRAARYARKFYPWYLERLGVRGRDADAFQRTESLDQARELLASLGRAAGRSPPDEHGALSAPRSAAITSL